VWHELAIVIDTDNAGFTSVVGSSDEFFAGISYIGEVPELSNNGMNIRKN
jgi:hypothetical protein